MSIFLGSRCPNSYPYAFMWGKYCCKTENEDSLEEHIVSEKTSVEKDSLTDTNENVKSNKSR